MANEIVRKDLWRRLPNIKKRDDWIHVAETLGLNVTQPKGGSSHYAIRFPNYENHDIRGLVSNVYDPVRKDISEAIFKSLLRHKYKEDDIWRALGFLK